MSDLKPNLGSRHNAVNLEAFSTIFCNFSLQAPDTLKAVNFYCAKAT